ncbi:HNH endonuclease [Mycolicibacterium obuense]|uniref:HNH endonuclease n=1 Tax=Mycolicibacterium obuense TaxID=1807 RepID=UPI0012FEC834|nr:HNH endonuclease [Mycolicibacterium obuense]
MRKLDKSDIPASLAANGAQWTAKFMAVPDPSKPVVWRDDELVASLKTETHAKCAYCEGKILDVSYAHVEHILPKSERPELVVTWTNLTIACQVCNTEKREYHDVSLPLVNPFTDDPTEFLEFNGPFISEKDGNARGERTVDRLNLGRTPLLLARAEKIDFIRRLLSRWQTATGTEKDTFELVITRELEDDREFVQSLRAFASAKGFPT